MEYKIIVSYQDGKTIQKEVKDKQAESLFGLKIGEEFNGETIGLSGHVLKITGGSDKDGFPMRKDLDGGRRVKLLLSKSVGFRPVEDGERRKKRVRGNTVNEDTVQINTKVIKPEKYENPEEKKAEEAPKEEVKETPKEAVPEPKSEKPKKESAKKTAKKTVAKE